jgi:hypothetical protein
MDIWPATRAIRLLNDASRAPDFYARITAMSRVVSSGGGIRARCTSQTLEIKL